MHVCVGVVWQQCMHVVIPGIVCCIQKMLFVVGPALLHLPFKAQLLHYRQFNVHKSHVLPTQCIYVFCVDLRTNSDYFPIQHKLIGFCNRDGVCLLRGTSQIFN